MIHIQHNNPIDILEVDKFSTITLSCVHVINLIICFGHL
jgi:hypothetical protein